MSSAENDRTFIIALAVVGLLTLLYSVLIAGRPLAWFSIAIPLVLLYLAWRLISAVERIAAALEETNRTRDDTDERPTD